MKRRIIIINLFLFLSFFSFINVYALPNPTSEFYVNDYADILSDETEEYIVNHSNALNEKTKAQIVVVTVDNLGGRDIESYATELFRKFGIGDKNENNGLLLLLAKDERKFRVEVGYGLENVLTDGLTGRYQDEYIIPYLKNNEWDNGIKNGYNAFYKKICGYYGIDADDVSVVASNTSTNNTGSEIPGIYIPIFGFCLLLGVLFGILLTRYVSFIAFFVGILFFVLGFNLVPSNIEMFVLVFFFGVMLGYSMKSGGSFGGGGFSDGRGS